MNVSWINVGFSVHLLHFAHARAQAGTTVRTHARLDVKQLNDARVSTFPPSLPEQCLNFPA